MVAEGHSAEEDAQSPTFTEEARARACTREYALPSGAAGKMIGVTHLRSGCCRKIGRIEKNETLVQS